MQIRTTDIRPGDNLIFKRAKGVGIALVLSLIIKLFYPQWDMWGWHMGVVVYRHNADDWSILEATWPAVRTTRLSQMGNYQAYRWLDSEPSADKIETFVENYLGKRYDVLLYPWTAVQYLVRHYWNRPIPRLLDDRFTCWELAVEFDEDMGKPLCSKYDCPILPDIQQELEEEEKGIKIPAETRTQKTLAIPYPGNPDMATGMENHVWTIEEIVRMPD